MRRISRAAAAAALLVAAAGLPACASSGDPTRGRRVLEAMVVDREYEPPGSGTADFRGSGNYYLVFETREGEATARYRYQVKQQQYVRFPEGARVAITLVDNDLRDIRPLP